MAEDDLIQTRRAKLDDLVALGLEAWPRRFDRTHTVSEVGEKWAETAGDALEEERPVVTTAGRIMAMRKFGKAAFLKLSDGRRVLQVHVKRDVVEGDGFAVYKLLDIGDFVGVEGPLFRTRTDELTVEVRTLTFLGKAIRPLPEKWHGLTDKEARYRQRYLDLLSTPEVRKVFELRTSINRTIRSFLDDRGFLEVETPMMQPLAGGATARPFVTHHNALDIELFLRIAPELYLKRLVVGGFEKVYELNRNFRNEGLSQRHNPEFTMLEFYEAYADYASFMELVEELITSVAETVVGTASLTYQERSLDLGKRPWARVQMREAVKEAIAARADLEFDPEKLDDEESLQRWTDSLQDGDENPYAGLSWGQRIYRLFEELVEPGIWEPTFVYDFPVDVSPLAKRSPDDPRFVERFEVFIGGFEVANAFSELNDPDDQRKRFENQVAERETGDDEAHPMDEDYTLALEHGLPPTAGAGIGIDRITMLLSDARSIRDVILFPLMRPK